MAGVNYPDRELQLARPRQWGACWLALKLWNQLELDSFWQSRLLPSREGTPWLKVPTTDGRELRLSRYTQPEAEHRMLLQQLRLSLPEQPPPKISAAHARKPAKEAVAV